MSGTEWKRAERQGVPTSQLLVPLQIGRDIDGLWLEGKLVRRGSRQHPALGGAIPGMATMGWTGVETVRKAKDAHFAITGVSTNR